MATQNLAAICENCGNPKSHHSKFDTHCLQVMAWKAGDCDLSPEPAGKKKTELVGAYGRHIGESLNSPSV
jgi:hypothetical protein